MPATSEKQRRFMGADLARAEAGQKTRTGMSVDQLKDFARKPRVDASANPKRAMAKARAGKGPAAERRIMQGGPGPEGFTRL